MVNIKPNKLKELFPKIIEKFIITKIKNNNNIYNIQDIDNFSKIKIEQDTGGNRLDMFITMESVPAHFSFAFSIIWFIYERWI